MCQSPSTTLPRTACHGERRCCRVPSQDFLRTGYHLFIYQRCLLGTPTPHPQSTPTRSVPRDLQRRKRRQSHWPCRASRIHSIRFENGHSKFSLRWPSHPRPQNSLCNGAKGCSPIASHGARSPCDSRLGYRETTTYYPSLSPPMPTLPSATRKNDSGDSPLSQLLVMRHEGHP